MITYRHSEVPESVPCPECGKKAIGSFEACYYGRGFGSAGFLPATHQHNWQCGCGWVGEEFEVLEKTVEEAFMEKWELANEVPAKRAHTICDNCNNIIKPDDQIFHEPKIPGVSWRHFCQTECVNNWKIKNL